MANRSYDDRTPDGTSDPLHLKDLIGVSNTNDGGTTYDLSKKIEIEELKDFIATFLGSLSGTTDAILMFTPDGSTAGDSPLTHDAGDIRLLTGDLRLGPNPSANYKLYVDGDTDQDTTAEIYNEFTGTGDVEGLAVYAEAGNTGNVIGVYAIGTGGTLQNIAVFGGSGSNNPSLGTFPLLKDVGAWFEAVGSGGATEVAALVASTVYASTEDIYGAVISAVNSSGNSYALQLIDGSEGTIGHVWTSQTTDGKGHWEAVSLPTEILGGVTLSSSSNTNILNGTYVILADTTVVTSVTSGVGQDSNWTLEITQAGITNQKGVVTATVNLEKGGGGGVNYDIAIFKNGSIIAESEQVDQKLESTGKGQSVTVMAITEFSTSDTFDIRVSGNGTADDIFCGGGTLFIR